MQRYLNTTHRTAVWFKKTFEADDLIIKPPFQRNPVWSTRQKSSLIDTILLEYPIPELYMQEVTDADGNQKHILVDGQQRIRAVLSYLAGEFELEEFYQQYETSFEDKEELRGIFVRVLGEIDQLLPDIAKTRWRKKSDFYTLFVKLAKHSAQLPLTGDKRDILAQLVMELANRVDHLIANGPPSLGPGALGITSEEEDRFTGQASEYLRNVERAASDLGSRKERERVLDELLAPVLA